MLPLILFLTLIRYTIEAQCKIELDYSGQKLANCKNRGFQNVPDNLPTDIRSIDLNENHIRELRPYAFGRYTLLKEIVLDNNNLSYIHDSAFVGICKTCLKILSLSKNQLNASSSYGHNVFEPLVSLEILDLSKNIDKHYQKDYAYSLIPIHDLQNLRELSIDLVSEPQFGKSFLALKSLEKITFSYCVAKRLTNKSFENLPESLKEMHMASCLYQIDSDTGLFNSISNLSVLNLTNTEMNLITVLQMLKPFEGKTMDGLFLRGVTNVDDEVILTPSDMKYIWTICLRALDISQNIIISLNGNVFNFEHPECLEYLLISGNRFQLNKLGWIFMLFISSLKNLIALDYSYIPLKFKNEVFLNAQRGKHNDWIFKENTQHRDSTHHFEASFQIPSKLQFFRVTHLMSVQGFNEYKFVNSSLEHAELSYFDTEYFPFITFEGSNRMKHLDMSGIDSTLSLGDNKISKLNNLKTLIIQDVKFYKAMALQSSLFDWCKNIQRLDLSYNFLTYLRSESFNILLNLQYLNLSKNFLGEIPEVITQLESLEILDLSFNHLTTLPEKFLNWLDKQRATKGTFRVYLNQNPFTCSCQTKSFIRWLSETKVTLDEKGNYSCWVTQTGRTNYTKTVNENFHSYFAHCDAGLWLHIGISLLGSLCTIIFLLALFYNFRWRIVFFFIRNFRKCAEKGLHLSYDYDVYISYSYDGASFVKKLSEKIEHEWGFKICIEARDFLCGETMAEETANSIHKSRHAIFLITPSVVENEWTRFEIERATFEKCARNLQKIIVIIKCSDQTTISIPEEFHLLWKDAMVIEWPDSRLSDEEEMTWKKLKLWFF